MNMLVTSCDPLSSLMKQSEFEYSEAIDFITVLSGRSIDTTTEYQIKLAKSLQGTLLPDISTATYKVTVVKDEMVMRLKEGGKSLISRSVVESWIASNSDIFDYISPYLSELAQATKNTSTLKHVVDSKWYKFGTSRTRYFTEKELEQFSRKSSLLLNEVVQLLHLNRTEFENMSADMLDTYDTLNREIINIHGKPAMDHMLYPTREILTIAARLRYLIPRAMITWVELPIEGLNWPSTESDRSEIKPSSGSVDLENSPRLLKIAVEAWERVWVKMEAHDRHPKQYVIISWLRDNYSVTKREAEHIDQIIRPDDKKIGARKK
ncbi:MAG: hypothetical protein RPU34_11315 [Candidatus Sedimenticola sp. (ex Thyasira tokunagai)]